MVKIKKNRRDKLWKKLEIEIQSRVNQKDIKFILSGNWKKFVRKQDGFKIYVVDGAWIRNNICVYFDHGGHGYVYEFIPMDEIWITTHHWNESRWNRFKCRNAKKLLRLPKKYFESSVIHELEEFSQMQKGKTYWKSHNLALEKEKKAGILNDPYSETE